MKKTDEEQNEYSELTEQDWIMLNHLPKPDIDKDEKVSFFEGFSEILGILLFFASIVAIGILVNFFVGALAANIFSIIAIIAVVLGIFWFWNAMKGL